jgi:hypothetical protein
VEACTSKSLKHRKRCRWVTWICHDVVYYLYLCRNCWRLMSLILFWELKAPVQSAKQEGFFFCGIKQEGNLTTCYYLFAWRRVYIASLVKSDHRDADFRHYYGEKNNYFSSHRHYMSSEYIVFSKLRCTISPNVQIISRTYHPWYLFYKMWSYVVQTSGHCSFLVENWQIDLSCHILYREIYSTW